MKAERSTLALLLAVALGVPACAAENEASESMGGGVPVVNAGPGGVDWVL